MRSTLRLVAVFLVATLLPSPVFPWGFVAQRDIMNRAIDLLPPELQPFFVRHRDDIVLRVVDPDLWRNVGWPEGPHHLLDFGVSEYGTDPFTVLPRDYDAAVEKVGKVTIKRNGLLPWREAEMFGNLRRAFEVYKRQAPYTVSDTILFSAAASHYVQDTYQPFHATIDYDGARTGQRGIHARFERGLFERFSSRLSVNPPAPMSIKNVRDRAFETLLASYQLIEVVLKADKDASAGRATYDEEHYEKFFILIRPILEGRLAGAISATAGLIAGAWEQAGRPALRLEEARSLEKVGQ